MSQRTTILLEKLVSTFPSREKGLRKMLSKLGMESNTKFDFDPPIAEIGALLSFDEMTMWSLSPSLKARFQFAGTIRQGPDLWVTIPELNKLIHDPIIQSLHRALRNNWENSVPARYADNQLSVFGYTEDVADSIVYLIWNDNETEPMVADYNGQRVNDFACLDAYLDWQIGRSTRTG